MNDDFNIENINVEIERPSFNINEIKLEHHYFNHDNYDSNIPIKTSVELLIKDSKWNKIIRHTYQDSEEVIEEILLNLNVIEEIKKYDLRNLKNNYFTEREPDNYTHWELTYNNYFKITGTYDQIPDEIQNIYNNLNMNLELKKNNKELKEI